MPVLEVRDLRVRFDTPAGVVHAVDGMGFTLEHGRTLAIVGESGCGKTVTALSLLGLISPAGAGCVEGSVLFDGRDLMTASEAELCAIRGDRVAMVFQDPAASLNPAYRVGAQVAEPLCVHRGLSRREAYRRAVELLEAVGIADAEVRARDYPHRFSGGMLQRAAIAMALSCEPEVIVADEPTSALDVTVQDSIVDLLGLTQRRIGSAILLITHDLGLVAGMADEVLVMYAGRAVEHGSVHRVFRQPAHPYTWALLDALPDLEAKDDPRPTQGQPPDPVRLPSGCAFHPRCPHAEPRCCVETPMLRESEEGHRTACHLVGRDGFGRGAGTEVA